MLVVARLFNRFFPHNHSILAAQPLYCWCYTTTLSLQHKIISEIYFFPALIFISSRKYDILAYHQDIFWLISIKTDVMWVNKTIIKNRDVIHCNTLYPSSWSLMPTLDPDPEPYPWDLESPYFKEYRRRICWVFETFCLCVHWLGLGLDISQRQKN